MNRRDALKNLGLSLGYVVATPTLLNMLQSCTAQPEKWDPLFFSEKQVRVLEIFVDLIIPKTKGIAGALDVNVPKFIDLHTSKAASEIQQQEYVNGLNAIMEELDILNEEPVTLEVEKFDAILAKYLRLTKAERLAYIEEENPVFETLTKIRDQTVWAYKSSEQIGKHVLAYDPIPGKQIGCTTVEKATGGKAWSL